MKKNKSKLIIVLVLFLVVGTSIGYAALSTTLNISGTANVAKTGWDVHFADIYDDTTNSTVTPTKSATIASANSISFSVNFAKPGDRYVFYVDVVNAGTLSAKINKVSINGVSKDLEVSQIFDNLLGFKIYEPIIEDGELIIGEFNVGSSIPAGQKRFMCVEVWFKEDVSVSQLPTTAKSYNINLSMEFVQA